MFRAMLGNTCQEALSREVSLPETKWQTFEHIAVWVMSAQPELDPTLPVPVIVDIAIFATVYMFPAILHQALDIFRAQIIRHCRNVLTPRLVEHIYTHVDKDSLLRHMTRAALAALEQSWAQGKGAHRDLEKWLRIIERYPLLGADYFFVQAKGWSVSDLAEGGSCRFHRHSVKQGKWITSTSQFFCSKSMAECFETTGHSLNEGKAEELSSSSRKHKQGQNAKAKTPNGDDIPTEEKVYNQDQEPLSHDLSNEVSALSIVTSGNMGNLS